MMINTKEHQSPRWVASETGYNIEYIRQLCRDGKISATKVGGVWLIERGAVARYKAGRRGKNTLRALAEKHGVSHETIRQWKINGWEPDDIPPKN
jgi:excisionase family DNA binding protein